MRPLHSTPIDRTASRVIRRGVHWEPKLLAGREPCFDVLPPIREITPEIIRARASRGAQFVNLIGSRVGELTVVALAVFESKKKGAPPLRWVCRCSCGSFVYRTSKAIITAAPAPEAWRCPRCACKLKITGRPQ